MQSRPDGIQRNAIIYYSRESYIYYFKKLSMIFLLYFGLLINYATNKKYSGHL